MSLEDEIIKHSATVSTDAYSMSIGELISMYRDGELDLHPEWQRFFRWTDEQKSRLIESFLLGIPVPPIFVAERRDSKWDVIDGLQRLSTILQLMGELRDENDELIQPLVLTRTKYLPSLGDKRWLSSSSETELPEPAKIRLKRARLDVNIIKSLSDDLAKYEIFQRLNTGGSSATDQEVRNCLLIMANKEFYYWVRSLGEYDNFKNCIPLTDRALEEAFDLELVSRFIVLATSEESYLKQIDEFGTFITDELLGRANDNNFIKNDVDRAFRQTFDYLAEHLGQDCFRKYDANRNRYLGQMLVSLFEIVGVGLGHRFLTGGSAPPTERFLQRHKSLHSDGHLSRITGSGVRASTRVPQTVAFGREWLRECE